MQIPLLSGITASELADFNLSYPVNLEPVPTESGISSGYLRSAMGAVPLGTGPGKERAGIVWNAVHLRIMGSKLVSVSDAGIPTVLGDVGDDGKPARFVIGNDRLAIRSGTTLYFWDGATLVQVTDPDLGPCLDIEWLNGQFFSTDGKYIVALQLSDPTQIDPLKYGQAESDPDGITGLIHQRGELHVTGGTTIDVLTYAGGPGFPLQLSEGATIPIGVVGANAKCIYSQSFAFVGAARNNTPSVWLAGAGTAAKLSTRAIDDVLAAEPDPGSIVCEARVARSEQRLYVHLSDRSLVYCNTASQEAGKPVWYTVRSGRGADKAYRLRNAVLVGNRFICGDTGSAALGIIDESVATHFGEAVGWSFDTMLLYNKALSAIVHSLDLTGLPGRGVGAHEPSARVSWTLDGETWSLEKACRTGGLGARRNRIRWAPHKRFRNYMGLRFQGDSNGLVGFAALEAEIEALKA